MTSTIDTSAIDVTKPATGNPTTQSMRDNNIAIKSGLDTAKSEISALQAATSNISNTSDVNKPVSTAQAEADTAVLNESKSYADSIVVGLLDDRGSYNASSNSFPTSGGSGTAGAILKGDMWFVSVAGTLGGTFCQVGTSIRALVDTPAQTAANWGIVQTTLGFTPENASNKDASGGYVGKTLEKINIWNTARTFLSFFVSAATAARTWTFPNKDGTVAMTNDLPAYNCKAFVNFDGTLSGTITPRASGNIASVVKNSAGAYTITMTDALADANYVVTGSLGGAAGFVLWRVYDESAARTATMFRVIVFNTAGSLVDLPQCNFAVFR